MTTQHLDRMNKLKTQIDLIDWTFHFPSDTRSRINPIHRAIQKIFQLKKDGHSLGYHYGSLKHDLTLQYREFIAEKNSCYDLSGVAITVLFLDYSHNFWAVRYVQFSFI